VLFFGDSATRGYGVGRERRYATLVGERVRGRTEGAWDFAVGATLSDFRAFRERLGIELGRVQPEVLVCQCPVGPACSSPRFPPWARAIMAVEHRLVARLAERYVSDELREDGDRTRQESLYEGRWLTRLHRWRPSNWPVFGPLWKARASRYPPVHKVTVEGYVDRMRRLRAIGRERGAQRFLFVGLIPVADDVCVGYLSRAPAWCAAVRSALDEPHDGSRFVDVFTPLLEAGLDRVLLNDRVHLSVEGHRVAAGLVGPALEPLLVP